MKRGKITIYKEERIMANCVILLWNRYFGNRKNDSIHDDEKYEDAIRVVALANIRFM